MTSSRHSAEWPPGSRTSSTNLLRPRTELRHNWTKLSKLETVTQPLHECLSSEQWQRLTALASNSVRPTGAADPVDQTDREERIATLLESRGLRDAWQVAPTLAAAGWEPPALDELIADMPALAAGNVFRWLEARLSIDSLLDEASR